MLGGSSRCCLLRDGCIFSLAVWSTLRAPPFPLGLNNLFSILGALSAFTVADDIVAIVALVLPKADSPFLTRTLLAVGIIIYVFCCIIAVKTECYKNGMVVDVVDIIDNEIYRITPMLQHGDYYATKWVY